MNTSLIITSYNRPDALLLVLRSIERQITPPHEVIIADDGSTNETQKLINQFQENSKLNLIHSWQQDKGFRAAKSRNKAISKSTGGYIVLIDGDMILHPNFIQDHINSAESGFFVQGSRVLLTQKATVKAINRSNIDLSFVSMGLQNRKNAIHSNALCKLLSQKKNYLRGIKTCNMAFYRQDCISVNGFNNEFEGWGREDSEFIVRLMNSGISRKTIRFNAIQFHLWHQENIRTSLERNDALLQSSINNNMKWCDNGIDQIRSHES